MVEMSDEDWEGCLERQISEALLEVQLGVVSGEVWKEMLERQVYLEISSISHVVISGELGDPLLDEEIRNSQYQGFIDALNGLSQKKKDCYYLEGYSLGKSYEGPLKNVENKKLIGI